MSFPRYSAYKSCGIEWITQLPEHWRVQPFVSVVREREEPNAGAVENNLLSLSYGKIVRKDISSNDGLLPESFETYQVIHPDDVVLRLTDLQNDKRSLRSAIVEERGIITSAYVAVIPAGIHPRYLAYLLRAYDLKKVFYSMGGGLRQSIKFSDLKRMPTVVPPRSEQRTIVQFLDRETVKIDALIAEQERLIELLKEKSQAAISQAVTKGLNAGAPLKISGVPGLGDIPADWEISRIATLSTKITNGYVGPTRDILKDQGVRYLQSLHIKDGQIRFETPYFVSPEWSQQHEKSILQAGNVLIVQTGDIGQVAVVPDAFSGCNCHALIIVAPEKGRVMGEWVGAVLRSEYGRQSLLSIQTGALHPHLNCGDVRDVRIPVPPIPVQRSILNYTESMYKSSQDLIQESSRGIKLLRERRAALISAAVTGQIDVRGVAELKAA